jgi:GAF domain-containing protein
MGAGAGASWSAEDLIEAISSELALRPLLSRLVRAACGALHAEHGAIGLFDEEAACVEIAAVHGLPSADVGQRLPPGVGLGGSVLLHRRSLVYERYEAVPGFRWPDLGQHAVVAVPITWRERFVGFLGVGAPPPRRFGAEDIEQLDRVARQAAVAIENARRFSAERRRSERMALIARVARIITAGLTLNETLQGAADAVHELLGYPAVGIATLDPKEPQVLVFLGLGGVFRDIAAREYRLPVSEGIMGAAVRERQVQLVNDVSADLRYIPPPGSSGIHAELALPIALGRDVLGVLNVESGEPFTPEDALSLGIVADHLAVAIRNARHFEAEKRRTERLATMARVGQTITAGLELDEMLQAAADAIHDLVGYANVDIPLLDPDDPGTLVIRARGGRYKAAIPREDRLPVSVGIMGSAVVERRVQLVNDVAADPRYVLPGGTERSRAELALPIMLGAKVLGVLNVEGEGPFDAEDVTYLEIIADHLALAIRNARLYEGARVLAALGERERLARDLHDSVTQLLFSVTLIAQAIGPAFRRDPAEGERHVKRLLDLARAAHAELRALLVQLQLPEPVEKLLGDEPDSSDAIRLRRDGPGPALRSYGARLLGASVRIEVDDSRYRRQSPEHEETLYRIGQEALGNVAKHGRARSVCLVVEVRKGRVSLAVRDDGVGFDPRTLARRSPAPPVQRNGLGIPSMRERVRSRGGRLDIRSGPLSGTTIRAVLPVDRA